MANIDDFLMPDEAPEPSPQVDTGGVINDVQSTVGYREKGTRYKSEQSQELPIPSNVPAEIVILGAILLDNDALKEVGKSILPTDLYLDSHQRIFTRMLELWEEGKPVDILTLSTCLNKHKEIEAVGGVAFLASLTEGLPRRPVITEYVKLVKDRSIARRIMRLCDLTIARAADQSEDSATTLATVEQQLAEIKDESRLLLRSTNPVPFFVGARTFLSTATEEIEWTIEGIIQKEGNGLILGDSGSSKSVLTFDLALHLISGIAWFQHKVPKRLKVGMVAREDAPGLSQSRLKRLLKGSEAVSMCLEGYDLDEWLYFNTRSQRETWTLEKDVDIIDIVESIKERQINFVFLDVFRALWEGNENDNQETAKVLGSATRISREANCQVCIVHHLSKSEKGTIFDRARGGGINGWKEWGIGLNVENPEVEPKNRIRKIQFHTKADADAPSIYYRIDSDDDWMRLEQIDAPSSPPSWGSGKKGKGKKDQPAQQGLGYNPDSEPDISDVPF